MPRVARRRALRVGERRLREQRALDFADLSAYDRRVEIGGCEIGIVLEETHRRVSRAHVSWTAPHMVVRTRVLEKPIDLARTLSSGNARVLNTTLQRGPSWKPVLQRKRALHVAQCRNFWRILENAVESNARVGDIRAKR